MGDVELSGLFTASCEFDTGFDASETTESAAAASRPKVGSRVASRAEGRMARRPPAQPAA
eukprot:355041-Chlamydomonas_euryale.AAC.13